jgi:hypothetical protein
MAHERVDDEKDPNRCQGVIANGPHAGQCFYKASPGSEYCSLHGGHNAANAEKKAAIRNYKLRQYQERVGELADSTSIKDLREEIGIIRMTLEAILNQCESPNKLLIYSGQITNLVMMVSKLITTCQQLEERNNNLLERKVVIVIADSIVTLIGQYITDPDTLNELGARICESIESAASPTHQLGVVA